MPSYMKDLRGGGEFWNDRMSTMIFQHHNRSSGGLQYNTGATACHISCISAYFIIHQFTWQPEIFVQNIAMVSARSEIRTVLDNTPIHLLQETFVHNKAMLRLSVWSDMRTETLGDTKDWRPNICWMERVIDLILILGNFFIISKPWLGLDK